VLDCGWRGALVGLGHCWVISFPEDDVHVLGLGREWMSEGEDVKGIYHCSCFDAGAAGGAEVGRRRTYLPSSKAPVVAG